MITLNDIPENYLKKIEIYIQYISKNLNIDFQNENFDQIIKLYQLFIVEYLYFKNNKKNDNKLLKKIDSLNYKNNTLYLHVKATLPFYYQHFCNIKTEYSDKKISDNFLSIFYSLRSLNSYNNTFNNQSALFSNFKFYFELFFKESLLMLKPFLIHFVIRNKEDLSFVQKLFLNKESDDSFLKEYVIFILDVINTNRINTLLYTELFLTLQEFSLVEYSKQHYTKIIIKEYLKNNSLSEDVFLFLNKMFDKKYDFQNMKALSLINLDLFLKMYEMEHSLFLENLNSLHSFEQDFLIFKENMNLKKQMENF